jgi:hypothetical protein
MNTNKPEPSLAGLALALTLASALLELLVLIDRLLLVGSTRPVVSAPRAPCAEEQRHDWNRSFAIP